MAELKLCCLTKKALSLNLGLKITRAVSSGAECRSYKPEVTGSNPVPPTTSACHSPNRRGKRNAGQENPYCRR